MIFYYSEEVKVGKKETSEWIGVDGQRYNYSVHDLPTNFEDGKYGNYIFAKKSNDGHWIPIYIGQGDLGVLIGKASPQLKCIKELGATHVHVHENDSEWVRTSEEYDLLESYVKAFKPFGCNYKGADKKKEKGEGKEKNKKETLFE
jgi:hypothetical protein